MIAVIPMMGLGTRFSQNGYSEYKPFVRTNTDHLIKKVIKPLFGYFEDIFVVCNKEIESQIISIFGDSIKCIVLPTSTRGASETLLLASEYLPDNKQIACIDCDIIIDTNALEKIKNITGNYILTFVDNDKLGIYSYIELNNKGNIKKIKEKEAISNIANSGVYGFQNKDLLSFSCKSICELDGELYLSRAVQFAIDYGYKFSTIDISNEYNCCGTPYQLKDYSKKYMDNNVFTICFDVDGTLIYDLYTNPIAIEKNVKFCNEAYYRGYKIILHTARGMLSKNGDPIKIESQRSHIEKVLKDNSVLYHKLILMKPYADLYIDDKAIASHKDLEKETGLYLFEDHKARIHNKISVVGNLIYKNGNLKPESYYYNTLPSELAKFFPKINKSNDNCIVLERISQPTYSSLLLSQRLTKKDIDVLLDNLQILHKTKVHVPSPLNLQWAYNTKVKDRLKTHSELYKTLQIDINRYMELSSVDMNYSIGRIHGDPVFTNIFSMNGYCKFIDVRGEWDDQLTPFGDIYYDYAKILQSLYGYDYILHNEPIPDKYLQTLREYFFSKIEKIINHSELTLRVKLLVVSLIPFHTDDMDRCKNFVKLLKKIN